MMEFSIVRPIGTKSLLAKKVDITTLSGNQVILPGHATAFLVIKPNSSIFVTDQSDQVYEFVLSGGLVEVYRTLIRIIVND